MKTFILSVMAIVLSATVCLAEERAEYLLNAQRDQIRLLCEKKPKSWICSPSEAMLNYRQDEEKFQYATELYPISNNAIKLLREKPSTAVVFDAIYGGGDECQFIECLDIPEGYTIRETEEEKVARLFEDYQKGINVFCDKNSDLKDCWSPERLANEVVTGGKFITKIDKNFIMTHKNTVYICSMWYMDKVDKVQCHINPDE